MLRINKLKKHGGVGTPPGTPTDQAAPTNPTGPPAAPSRPATQTRPRTGTTARRTIMLPPLSPSDKVGPSQSPSQTLYVKYGNVDTHFTPAHCDAFNSYL